MIIRKNAIAFIDWRSQISNAKQAGEPRPDRKADSTLRYVAETISSSLEKTAAADLYRVSMRLYHGWHKGLTATPNRRALDTIFQENGAPSLIGRTAFDWRGVFGDILCDAEDFRRHPKLKNHLPNTLREDFERPGRYREKMVDTAIAVDLLHFARTEPADWRLVMAEDDDVVPAIFVAERWGKQHGGKTVILRVADREAHLNLLGLIWQIEARK